MAVYGKKLLDMSGNVILPKTRSSLVYMNNDDTVQETIEGILKKVPGNLDHRSVESTFLDNLAPGVYTITISRENSKLLGLSDGTFGMYGTLQVGSTATTSDGESFIRQTILDYSGRIASRSKLGSAAWTGWTVHEIMPKSGGTFSANVSGGAVVTIHSTGGEASINYQRESDGSSAGWTVGQGCASAGKKFCIFSHQNTANILTIDPDTTSISTISKNRSTWSLRNSIITASSWSPVASDSIWFIRG